MLFICFTNLHRSLVVVQVVVFLSECKTALTHVEDIHRHVFSICAKSRTEWNTITKDSIFLLDFEQVVFRISFFHLVQQRLHGCDTLFVPTFSIHCQFVEIREFALCRSLRKFLFLKLVQNRIDALVVVLLQLVEATEP